MSWYPHTLVSSVYAQVTLPLTVAPARQEVFIDPGETTAVNVKFYNRSDEPVSGLLKVADFIVEDKEGTPRFLETETPTVTGKTLISPRFAAASWVTLPYTRITIAAKDKVNIQAKITAPPDARPGGRYVAVYFKPSGALPEALGAPREAVSPVSVKIAGLVYLRVAGPITEEARITQFTAPRFQEYGPVAVTTEILNRGDYHIRPKGVITLIDFFGRPLESVKLEEMNIFPDASRVYENKLGTRWMFGKYKAQLSAAYGETGQALTATVFFWVFPWKVVGAIVLAVLIILLLINLSYRRFKTREVELEKKVEELEEKLEKEEKER